MDGGTIAGAGGGSAGLGPAVRGGRAWLRGEGTGVKIGRRQVGRRVAAVQGLGVVVLEVKVGLLLRGLIAWVEERGGGVSGLGHVEEHVLLLLLLLLVVVKVFWRGG